MSAESGVMNGIDLAPARHGSVGHGGINNGVASLTADHATFGAVSQILQELFSLTNAEADLAQALCAGKTTTAYASERRVTLNTVYSHLKRIREKTGCKSVPELIRKFAELDVPLRTHR